jgi:hypothetical protein
MSADCRCYYLAAGALPDADAAPPLLKMASFPIIELI